jgi:acyl-CoA synthetase (AMP-forming)/AMP-acid ligase II
LTAAAIGIPDQRGREALHAFIALAPGEAGKVN